MSGFDPVPRVSTTQHVQRQLIEAIRSGSFAPSSPLPSEKELGEMFGVSRVTIREALAGLVATGLVEIRQGKRAEVRKHVEDEYAGLFSLYMDVNRKGLQELIDVRGALDGLAALKAAVGGSDEALAEIERAARAFAEGVEAGASPGGLKDLDVAFHRSVAVASGSELLQRFLHDLSEQFVHSREILFARSESLQRSVDDHEAIVQAIVARDPEAARSRASSHVSTLWDWFNRMRAFTPGDAP